MIDRLGGVAVPHGVTKFNQERMIPCDPDIISSPTDKLCKYIEETHIIKTLAILNLHFNLISSAVALSHTCTSETLLCSSSRQFKWKHLLEYFAERQIGQNAAKLLSLSLFSSFFLQLSFHWPLYFPEESTLMASNPLFLCHCTSIPWPVLGTHCTMRESACLLTEQKQSFKRDG